MAAIVLQLLAKKAQIRISASAAVNPAFGSDFLYDRVAKLF